MDEHLEKVLDTLSDTNKLIDHMKSENGSDTARAEKLYNRISMQERSADHIQDELANEIARGILPPEIAEKLFRLVRLIDSTANWAKTAGKDLVLLTKLNIETPQYSAIFTILDNRQIVEDREREADTILFSAKEEILGLGEEVGFSVHYLLLDAAQCLENSSDSVSKAAEVLYTIVMLGTPA